MGIGTGTAALVGGLASAGAGIAGSAMQAGAAGSAAAAQAQAAQKGINIANQNTQAALQAQLGATQGIQGLYQPYAQAGQVGLGQLQAALSPGGSLTQGWGQTFQAPTAAQAAATPGYQFTMQQGLQAAENSAAARGTLLSTGTMKGLENYASGLASQTYQQTYNNALQGYQQNYATWANNQQNLYNRLSGLTGIGQNATGAQATALQAGAGGQAGIYGQNTAALAQLLGSQGAAQASGLVGGANAWAGGLNQIGGAAQGYANFLGLQGLLQNLQTPQPQVASQGDLQTMMNTLSPFGQQLSGAGTAPPISSGTYQGLGGQGSSIYAGYNPLGGLAGNVAGYDPYALYGPTGSWGGVP